MKNLKELFLKQSWKAICIQAAKLSMGCTLSILIAYDLGLANSPTAGIITVLSIQGTKVETLKTAARRLSAFLLMLLAAGVSYRYFDYTTFAFGIFLFIFVFLCMSLRLGDAISMNAVLASHFLTRNSMSLEMIGNEAALLWIGAGMGIIMNLHLKRNDASMKLRIRRMDEELREILNGMAEAVLSERKRKEDDSSLHHLEEQIMRAEQEAWQNHQNTILGRSGQQIRYIQMRREQCEILHEMYKRIRYISITPAQAEQISRFLLRIVECDREEDDGKELLKELEHVFAYMKKEKLPEDREEFESRALLYVFLHNIQEFLEIKYLFASGEEKI